MAFSPPNDTPPPPLPPDPLATIFDLLDLQNNGDLDFPEFKVGLTSIDINLTQDEAVALFDSIDAENKEYVNREMFLKWVSKPSTSTQLDTIRNKLIEYIQEIEDIKNHISDADTTPFLTSEEDDHSQSDSLNSEERREIIKAKQKQQRRNSKKFAQNELDSADDLETSLMQQQMVDMMKQQKYALDR
eukprot:497803_1